jgi:hypothetical protein
MNENEKATADALLEKIKTAAANEVVQPATAYHSLTQGALNRKNAEAQPKRSTLNDLSDDLREKFEARKAEFKSWAKDFIEDL